MTFSQQVEVYVKSIPVGRVMTYGQLAALCGRPRAARIVGGIAHYGAQDIPWHSLVNREGGLASGYPGGRRAHKAHLQAEGIRVYGASDSYWIDVQTLLWWPSTSQEGSK